MFNIVILLSLVCLASCHDVIVGTNTAGRSIYDEVRHASPTIWRQTENVTITTTDAEVISRIVITDLRPDKDGDIKIVDGGEGQKNVTLELKSPTVLRGYDFHIQVFAISEDNFKSNDNKEISTESSQTRVQRNPQDNQKPDSHMPGTVTEDTKNLDSSTRKLTPSQVSTDTKTNEDKSKSANVNFDGKNKQDNPVPFPGTPSYTQVTPTIVANIPVRHARETLNPEIPEEQKAPTKLPAVISRQGAFDKPTPQTVSTIKPETSSKGKRDTRDTEDNKKGSTTPKAFVPFVGNQPFNVPAVTIARTSQSADNETLDRQAREADPESPKKQNGQQKTNDDKEEQKDDEVSTKQPVIRPFNRRIPQSASTTNKSDANDGKRDGSDTKNDQKSDDSSVSSVPVVGNRFQSFNVPAVPKTVDINHDTPKNQKREALNLEIPEKNQNMEKKTENEEPKEDKTTTRRPLIISRQGSFNRPTPQSVSTPNKPESSSEGKRDARDTEHNDKSGNTTSIDTHAAHPRTGLDSTPLVNVKTDTTNPTETDKTENDNTYKPRGHFVPPIGYKRAAPTSIVTNEKDRFVRDVDQDKKLNPPTINTREDFKSEDSSKLSKDDQSSLTTESNNNLRHPAGLFTPRGTYPPRPYPIQGSTSTASPTTAKSQNKRETEMKEQKETEDQLKAIPRVLGNQNFTITEPKPVISIQ